jgi:hypothetical protein
MWLLEGIQKFENLQQSCLDLVNYIFAKIYLVGDTVPSKVRSCQIGSACEWYFWTGLEKICYFFIFDLEYLNEFKVLSHFMQK